MPYSFQSTIPLRFTPLVLLVLCCLVATGCATTSTPSTGLTADAQYRQALEDISEQRLTKAAATLKGMQIRFPFSEFTHHLHLELAKAYVDAGELDTATVMVNQFIATYPRHPYLDYAVYIKGLSNYARGVQALDVGEQTDPYQARTDLARASYDDLSHMIQRFPSSAYAEQAKDKLVNLRELLANHEIRLALASLDERDTTTARRRANYVIEHYPDTGARQQAENILNHVDNGTSLTAGHAPGALLDQSADTPSVNHGRHADTAAATPRGAPATLQSEPLPESTRIVMRENWIMQQSPSRYTIQVTTTNRPNWLNEFLAWLNTFLDKNEMQDNVAYYQRSVQGEQTYAVLYGSYGDLRTAQSAKAKLIQTLGIEDLWVRRYEEIQSAINTDTTHLN